MNQEFYNELEKILSPEAILINEPMSKHTTFRIGGNADMFVSPEITQVPEIMKLAKEYQVPVTIVGNGSNLLVGDKGIRGLVVAFGKAAETVTVDGNCIIAGAGANTNNRFGNMATYCTKYNQMNTLFREWYIPSCGQLALMCLNIDEINKALKKIGGKEISTLAQDSYWSSTECSEKEAWYVGFGRNAIINSPKYYGNQVRLIRDI